MSNKTSDKNVANIEDDVNELKSIMNLRTESGFAYSQKNTLKLQKSIRNVLAEREQDKKRIQELKEENERKDKFIKMAKEVIDNSILKQVVIETLNRHKFAYEELSKDYNNTHYEDDEVRARDFYMIVAEDRIVQVLQELLEGG